MAKSRVTRGGLQAMAHRVAQVQADSTGARVRVGLALVGGDDLDLLPGAALDQLGHGAVLENSVFSVHDRIPVRLEQLEQALVAEDGHLHRLPKRRAPLALGERTQHRYVDDDGGGLVECPNQVLALGQVDTRLASHPATRH